MGFIRKMPADLCNWIEDGVSVASVVMIHMVDGYLVDSFIVYPQYTGKGYGSKLLSTIISAYGQRTLRLKIGAYDHKRLDDVQLREWYRRYGFIDAKEPMHMIRKPTVNLIQVAR